MLDTIFYTQHNLNMKIFGKSILGEICDTISNSRRVYCIALTFLKVFKSRMKINRLLLSKQIQIGRELYLRSVTILHHKSQFICLLATMPASNKTVRMLKKYTAEFLSCYAKLFKIRISLCFYVFRNVIER